MLTTTQNLFWILDTALEFADSHASPEGSSRFRSLHEATWEKLRTPASGSTDVQEQAVAFNEYFDFAKRIRDDVTGDDPHDTRTRLQAAISICARFDAEDGQKLVRDV